MLTLFALYAGPGLLGALMLWFANKCKGKNAKDFFRLSGWGFLLLYLGWFSWLIPIGLGINFILAMAPSAICFFLAVSSIIREMRAQKNGEFTEAA
jgi:hypothetical protein